MRALNCLARSWVGLNVTLLAVVPASAPVTAASTPGSRSTRTSGTGGSGASKLRRAAAFACRTTSSRSTTRIGSGRASMIVAQHPPLRRHPPGFAAQLPAKLGHRRSSRPDSVPFRIVEAGPFLLARQALDPGGDGLQLAQTGARQKGADDEADEPSQHRRPWRRPAQGRRARPAPGPPARSRPGSRAGTPGPHAPRPAEPGRSAGATEPWSSP